VYAARQQAEQRACRPPVQGPRRDVAPAQPLGLLDLPVELVDMIATAHTPAEDWAQVAQVCRLLRCVVTQSKGQQQARRAFVRHVVTRLPLCRWAVKEAGCPLVPALVEAAAGYGSPEVLRFLRGRDMCPEVRGKVLFWRAAANGNMTMARYLYDTGCKIPRSACTEAAKRGHLAMVQWMVALAAHDRCSINAPKVFKAAIIRGHIAVAQFLHERAGEPLVPTLWIRAARSGCIDALEWLRERRCPVQFDEWQKYAQGHDDALEAAVVAATRAGQCAAVCWLHTEMGAPLQQHSEYLVHALKRGNVPLASWLRAHGCPWPAVASPYRAAARSGNPRALQWVHEGNGDGDGGACGDPALRCGCRLAAAAARWERPPLLCDSPSVFRAVLKSGAAPSSMICMMRKLRDWGFEWNDSVFTKAVDYSIEVIEWLHRAGCPMSPNTFYRAVTHRNIDLARRLHAWGCPPHPQAYEEAMLFGDLEMLDWLCDMGALTINDSVLKFALNCNSPAVSKWIHKRVPRFLSADRRAAGIDLLTSRRGNRTTLAINDAEDEDRDEGEEEDSQRELPSFHPSSQPSFHPSSQCGKENEEEDALPKRV
jgi:hypothetical protein